MSGIAENLASLVRQRLDGLCTDCTVVAGQATVEVPAAQAHEAALRLRDDPDLAFAQLIDLCGVDYLEYGHADWETSDTASVEGFSRGVETRVYDDHDAPEKPRFAVVSHLLSYAHNRRLRMRVFAEGEPPRVDSVQDVWPAAGWFEREAFDLYGILFVGHPDLRRILTDYGFIGHPFRKDFPLIGEVEMRYDPDKRRVVYEPVSIEPRTLVPRVIRHDARYAGEESTPAADDGGDKAAETS